ncbi:MAG: transposase, partial [Spirochaetes bacterium]|nr:transposase [Spirochaetota bacterium]
EFVIMPNHIHGIIIIENIMNDNANNDTVDNSEYTVENNVSPGAGNNVSRNIRSNVKNTVGNNALPGVGNNDRCSLHRNMELIPKVMSQFKSSVTRHIRKQFDNFDFAWQKSYHDHIIRDEKDLTRIREYIRNNPQKLVIDF